MNERIAAVLVFSSLVVLLLAAFGYWTPLAAWMGACAVLLALSPRRRPGNPSQPTRGGGFL